MTDRATFDSNPRSAKRARRLVADRLRGHDPIIVDMATLMVSELVTNSIRHATGPVAINLEVTTDRLRIDVSDAGPGTPFLRAPSPGENSGRGLRIIDELADAWGMTSNPETGNNVWFVLELNTAHSSKGTLEAGSTRH